VTTRFTDAELASLLGRPPRASVGARDERAFRGQRVVVTGAAGSIGSALAAAIASMQPAALALVDHSELGLFTIERRLRAEWPRVALVPFLADVSHEAAMRRIVASVQPDVVYHAAAYKHVTMAERAVASAVRVNVGGSVAAAAAAASARARFVLISSDKAAAPESVMGATKRVAEIATLSLASPSFRPIVVRFGNVIGSSGSVVELMRDAIRAGEPVPVTDPDATRYFMTASEAVALVLRADLLGRAAELFWLDMGEPVRVGDLTDRLIAQEAALGHGPARVEIIGLRPGEKRNETLADPGLTFQRTIDSRILVARERMRSNPREALEIRRLIHAARTADEAAALAGLCAVLPSFRPSPQALEAVRERAKTTPAARQPAVRRGRRAA
jgi:FlaA1/EpsC-like NDP-sugar epimerase